MIITVLSDTHSKHHTIPKKDIPGGDLVIHAGDVSNAGYRQEIKQFLDWFSTLDYTHKVFIAGNHDWFFQDAQKEVIDNLLADYPNVIYLQDNSIEIEGIKIYGSPWQPEFYNWAFNLPRNGQELKEKWDMIPNDSDIVITHGPAFGHLDKTNWGNVVGCEVLVERLKVVKPKIHLCGHIHSARGYKFADGVHRFNAANLNERYNYEYKPFTFTFNKETNEIDFQ